MRTIKYIFLLVLCACSAYCQPATSGSITASGATCGTASACVTWTLGSWTGVSLGGATVQLSGTFSATNQFEATNDPSPTAAGNWYSIAPTQGTTLSSSATAAGIWQFNITGLTGLRVRSSAYSSGTVNVQIMPSTNSARSSGIHSGGTNTATNLPQFDTNGNLINSGATSDGSGNLSATTGTFSGAVAATSLATSPPCAGCGGGFVNAEGTTPSSIAGVTVPQSGYDAAYADSTAHAMLFSYNGGPWGYPALVVGSDSTTWTSTTGTGLIGSPITLVASTLPTGLYRADYEIAQLTHGNCTTPGTFSLRLGYTNGNTNVNYALSSGNSAVAHAVENAPTTLVNAFVLGTAINTGSANSGTKMFYALTGVAINYQMNQSVGGSGGTCNVFDTFQTVITVTKVRG